MTRRAPGTRCGKVLRLGPCACTKTSFSGVGRWSSVSTHRAPAGLDGAGRALWRRITADVAAQGMELRPDEAATLEAAARQADTLAVLQAALKGAPLTVRGSQGQEVAHPLLAEVRLGRDLLARLLSRLNLGRVEVPETPRSRSARRAAQARWSGAGRADLRGSTGA